MGKNVKKNKDEDKDKSYRERLAICDEVVGELISMLLDASQKEMAVQLEATVDQMQQLITEDKLFSIVKSMVKEVLSPYLRGLQNLKLTNPVSINGDPESSRGSEICNNIQVRMSCRCRIYVPIRTCIK
ncbi:elongation factor g, mitochondrial [Gossypium arboreum]|uniref:Elongation factor g, mitochondrial n=1 Tax=Gossypium arboreum TaxID=29729 RepID=A0A0B0P866_GOSAR|nr:elongation factor g, mitochondrial [Gossypium arboreum]